MKSITSMLYKARAELGAWACVLFSWAVIWMSALIKNQVDGTQVNELHSYLYLFVMSAVFFLCVIGAVILLNVVSRVSAERKIWFTLCLCIHYCAYLSLILIREPSIPLAQVGVFLISGIVLFIFGVE